LTVVSGTITGSDGPIADQEVLITCTHESVDYPQSGTSKIDGSYSVVFPNTECAPGDAVKLEALDKVVEGVVTNNCKCVVNMGILDLQVPEFGLIAGILALVGALGIIIYKRR
jgi:hypothetical protein